ncbi:MAG: hypothetical protein ACU0BK_17325 [Shimia sp.]|uniref:hypothetical protein n=1 Tax=Shimia sp. TaxID=1954381 RepID=UPI004057E88A
MILKFRIFSALGALFMAALLTMVLSQPELIKKSALSFTKAQIHKDIAERFPDLTDGPLTEGLSKLSQRFKTRSDAISTGLSEGVHLFVAQQVAKLCACENAGDSEDNIATGLQTYMQEKSAEFDAVRERLEGAIKGKYDILTNALLRDVAIFLGTNLAAFSAIFAATFVRNGKGPMLVYPLVLLSIALVVSASIYMFGTDWFYAILFQDYWGYGYAVLIGSLFLALIDITLNEAKITSGIVTHLPSALVPIC